MKIHILKNETINRIAAGEVVERPLNVVKELTENAIDAGATAVSIEIRDGGTSLIRVTDNGHGIEASQIPLAFTRHATSKIRDEADLSALGTLGFRGEALASIASVAMVEMITKTRDALTGVRAANITSGPDPAPGRDGGDGAGHAGLLPEQPRLEMEEIGAPDGTTVFVRNLFYNVPVRRKFLRSAQTEAGYITDLVEHLALSHPDISFHYRVNGQDKLHTTGSGDLRELIYRIYGKETAKLLLPVQCEEDGIRMEGFLGRPEASRSSRSFEIFFVNGRMLRSNILSRGLEAGYRNDLMQHRFPFAVLHLRMDPADADVNVHPSKMEVRFTDSEKIFAFLDRHVHEALHSYELIPEASVETAQEERARRQEEIRKKEEEMRTQEHAEPFERVRRGEPLGRPSVYADTVRQYLSQQDMTVHDSTVSFFDDRREDAAAAPAATTVAGTPADAGIPAAAEAPAETAGRYEQASLFASTDLSPVEENRILTEENAQSFRIVGQIFGTYWIVEEKERLLLIDQHAAHEKVNFEHLMARVERGDKDAVGSQMLLPACVVTLTGREEAAYLQYRDIFAAMGYEIDDLGQGSYAIRGVPLELFGSSPEELLKETLEEIMEEKLRGTPQVIMSRVATMSCKAAVKGSTLMKEAEAEALIRSLLSLEDPYHCPHGRPTMIIMSRADMDRKFKRIV